MNRSNDPDTLDRAINDLGRAMNVPDLVGLFGALGVRRRPDLAEWGPFKPGDDMAGWGPFKPGGDMSQMFGASGLNVEDVPALVGIANTMIALAAAKRIPDALREVQAHLDGTNRAALQIATRSLETFISVVEDGVKQSVALARTKTRGTPAGNGNGVHLHIHMGA